jgi:ribosomal protein S27E
VKTKKPDQPKPVPMPIPMRLHCPGCGKLHVDEGVWFTKPHHTHACQHCGNVWRPAVVDTVGVKFLPGFQNNGPVVVSVSFDGVKWGSG